MRVVWTITCMRTKSLFDDQNVLIKTFRENIVFSYENNVFSLEHITRTSHANILLSCERFQEIFYLNANEIVNTSQILARSNNSCLLEWGLFVLYKQLGLTKWENSMYKLCTVCVELLIKRVRRTVHSGHGTRAPKHLLILSLERGTITVVYVNATLNIISTNWNTWNGGIEQVLAIH